MNLKETVIQDCERYYGKGQVSFIKVLKSYFDTISENRVLSYIITIRL